MTYKQLREKWEQLHTDPAQRNNLRPEIRDSWERSYAYGVNKHLRENPYICTQAELRQYQDNASFLIEMSSSVMNNMYEFVSGTGFVVVLGDSNLCIVKVIGDEEALAFARSARLCEGAMWSEELVGTNAGALAFALAKPISVFGYEHFCLFSHVAACSCAPIVDQGKINGIIGMIAPFDKVNSHTLGMVLASTKHIKYKMMVERAKNYHAVLMDSIQEGLFAIDVTGTITYMNENCARSLKLERESIIGRSIYDLIGDNSKNHYFINKITSGRRTIDENFSLAIGGETLHCNVTCNPLNSPHPDDGAVVVVRESQRIKRLVRNIIGGDAKMTFEDIVGKDPEFLRSIKTANAASSSMSNILMLGESGTGKDILAQAMHNAGPRKNNPYLAINCAALPRELIASELFGYEEGAFTGARKGGNMGKFELADQGTIFLDEIGDMPLDLQASLLRVLEEKTVMRLGGTKQIPVNVRIIAATNQDLESMIENNRFRRDLYYRLAVIRINIPCLKSRPGDIMMLAEYFLKRVCERFNKPMMTFSSEVIDAFMNYGWPGNVREMQNVIEGAVQLAPGNVITADLVSSYLVQKDLVVIDNKEKENTVHELEKQMILEYLDKYKYNKTKVASALGISRRTLYRRLDEFKIAP